MKRISLVTLVVLPLFYLGGCGPSNVTPPAPTGPGWKSVTCAAGVECWITLNLNASEPEGAILRMSNNEYKTNFSGKEAAYLLQYKLISKAANKVTPTEEPCDPHSLYVPCNPGDPWTIIVTHTPNSTVIYIAFEHP
jgi:hypothetical protein